MMTVIVKFILVLFFISLVFFGVWLSYRNQVAASIAPFCAAFVCLIFYNPNIIKSFKGFGLEVELRQKIKEADELVDYLHDLALPLAEMNLSTMMRLGRWGTITPREERTRFYEKIVSQVRKLNFNQSEIDLISKDYHFFNIFDLKYELYEGVKPFLDPIQKELNNKEKTFGVIDENNLIKWNKYIERSRHFNDQRDKFESWLQDKKLIGNTDAFIQLVNGFDEFNQDVKYKIIDDLDIKIQDLRYYEENSAFRDFNRWIEKDK